MLMSYRNRNRCANAGCSCCDWRMAPRGIKSYRRKIRRIEKRMWKKDIELDY